MSRRTLWLASSCLVLLIGATVGAQPIEFELAFDSLPSAQGWTYEPIGTLGGDLEADCFLIDGGRLVMDTLGQPNAANCSQGGAVSYALDLGGTAIQTWRITFRARIPASDVLLFDWGFFAGVSAGGGQGSIGLSTDTLDTFFGGSVALDATLWHEYQLIGDVAAQSYSVYVDDQLVATSAMNPDGTTRTRFGDGTCSATARAEIDRFTVTLNPEEPVANEDSSWGVIKSLYR